LAHVYCGQMVRWIKMPLGREVGLGLRDIVLDGGTQLPQRGTSPNFQPMSVAAKGWMDQDATWYWDRAGLRPHCVWWRPSSPSPPEGAQQPPHFGWCLMWPNSRPSQLYPGCAIFVCITSLPVPWDKCVQRAEWFVWNVATQYLFELHLFYT